MISPGDELVFYGIYDVYPGLTFYFAVGYNDWDDPPREIGPVCYEGVYTVVTKDLAEEGGWRLLLLSPEARLSWYNGQLGWIRRVADPAWEARYEKDRTLAVAHELAERLRDTATALSA